MKCLPCVFFLHIDRRHLAELPLHLSLSERDASNSHLKHENLLLVSRVVLDIL